MKLSQDIVSTINKNKVYGRQGDTVVVVAYHSSVAIVEGINGERFPVKAELLISKSNFSLIK